MPQKNDKNQATNRETSNHSNEQREESDEHKPA